jgi:ribonuclease P protein component
MLARANRILKPSEFRMVMNTGERMSTKNFVFFYKRDVTLGASRFGFVVSKMVGGAVTRNAVKRKLRAQSRELLSAIQSQSSSDNPAPFWFVARCLPNSANVDSKTVMLELTKAFTTLSARDAR